MITPRLLGRLEWLVSDTDRATHEADERLDAVLGQMDAMSAFMSRKLQVKGDMGLAVKLQTLFKRPT